MVSYVYDGEVTEIRLDDEKIGTIDDKITNWRGNIPHPSTEAFGQFEAILKSVSDTDYRIIMLRLEAGHVERVDKIES